MTLAVEEILPKTVEEACAMIKSVRRKRVADVTLFDLILNASGQHRHLHGVYFVFAAGGGSILYIGRVQSPQFIERFPAHFALGAGCWQNQFLRHHLTATGADDFATAAIRASDCELLLLLSPQCHAAKLEALLIRLLRPSYNKKQPKAGLPTVIPPDSTIQFVLDGNVPPIV